MCSSDLSIADRLIRIRVHSLWGISMYLQKKETILIVDDSKFQRAIIKEMLGEHFHLEEATSGEECLMILEKSSHLIDLVLLDLVMPGIDGFEVLRRRQTMDAFKDINFCRCICYNRFRQIYMGYDKRCKPESRMPGHCNL